MFGPYSADFWFRTLAFYRNCSLGKYRINLLEIYYVTDENFYSLAHSHERATAKQADADNSASKPIEPDLSCILL
jgi:hypothetical protein